MIITLIPFIILNNFKYSKEFKPLLIKYNIWCKQNNLFPIKKIEKSQECSLQRLIMVYN